MKRMRVNLSVNDLVASIVFYNSLFDSELEVVKKKQDGSTCCRPAYAVAKPGLSCC
ncbi:MAG: hypothetical protein GY815_15625 [Gammaproteobacteria bacterium]|nr:hypothetical protein [Gammaproteobacteria bacterium]